MKKIVIGIVFLLLLQTTSVGSEVWKITAYCSCKKCCNKSDGIMASGVKAKYGYVACNWLPFKTEVNIGELGTFKVMDRGAVSHFGNRTHRKKRIDIWLPTHHQALLFGVQYHEVTYKLQGGL